MMEEMRLNKYLAACGVCSRRDADKLIEQGVVTVNGHAAPVGCRVRAGDEVAVRGKRVKNPDSKVVLAYYKPIGVTCTERDSHAEKVVVDEVKYPVRVTYAGRLDKDSEGLLLLTNDGDLINAMMRGSNGHEKEYIVKVSKEWSTEAIEQLRQGVYLKELDVKTRPCDIEQLGPKTIKMILTQGLNRQIRRMCKEEGYDVVSLKRTRVIDVKLANLKPGEYRELTETEKKSLYAKCGL
jgi:23S rRNA pseudouridine2604 synthase